MQPCSGIGCRQRWKAGTTASWPWSSEGGYSDSRSWNTQPEGGSQVPEPAVKGQNRPMLSMAIKAPSGQFGQHWGMPGPYTITARRSPMSIVAGVDFGTLSVRVSIFDSVQGRLVSGVAEYPLLRKKEDPDHATQSHADHMTALVLATRRAIDDAAIDGHAIAGLALDTTGSSVIPVDAHLQPIDDYYLWCDHRAWREAAEITAAAHATKLEAIDWCGGIYSSEWGFAKLLHWLRHNPDKRARFATALEHCDMVAAVLCGITDPAQVSRSICAMGHKRMWNARLGGLPPEDFLSALDPPLAGVRAQLGGRYATSDQIAGHLCGEWAARLGLRAGIPIPTGAFDAHWDAIGAGVRIGDVVNVVGTSTCIMAISD